MPVLATGRYPVERLVTHRLPLGEAEKALALVAGVGGRRAGNVVLTLEQ